MKDMFKLSRSVLQRLGCVHGNRLFSTPTQSVLELEKPDPRVEFTESKEESNVATTTIVGNRSGLVNSVFASLDFKDDIIPSDEHKKPLSRIKQFDEQIAKADNVNSLLKAADSSVVSRRNALKIVSLLYEWSATNKVKLSDFQSDPRFLKLCRLLSRYRSDHHPDSNTSYEDLNTVLSITGDDEAAKLLNNMTLAQLIKVMTTLMTKKRRSTPLLRSLAYNLTRQNETLDLKRSADLLFAMVSLNFPDEVLLNRVCSDVLQQLPENTSKPGAVASISTSLGLLKYKDVELLDGLSEWFVKHSDICRPQDVASIIITLATLGYLPANFEDIVKMATQLKPEELAKPTAWLDVVFALATLNHATSEHVSSVLSADMIDKLSVAGASMAAIKKLVLIDGYVGMSLPDYSGPRLPQETIQELPVVYSKEKQQYVSAILSTFKSLISSDNFLKKNCNSGLGFLFDAEFLLDQKCHPVPLEGSKTVKGKSIYRIALMGLDYHDLSKKASDPLGINSFYKRLLEHKGYNVLFIPYSEFNPKDKLITRVQYLEARLKELIASNPRPDV